MADIINYRICTHSPTSPIGLSAQDPDKYACFKRYQTMLGNVLLINKSGQQQHNPRTSPSCSVFDQSPCLVLGMWKRTAGSPTLSVTAPRQTTYHHSGGVSEHPTYFYFVNVPNNSFNRRVSDVVAPSLTLMDEVPDRGTDPGEGTGGFEDKG